MTFLIIQGLFCHHNTTILLNLIVEEITAKARAKR